MKLIIYCKGKGEIYKKLYKKLDPVRGLINTQTLHKKEELSIELSRNPFDKILVLLIVKKDELSDILSIKDSFHDVSIILIIPDGKPETVSKAWTIRPRFLSYTDSDFEDVSSVLKKMIELKLKNRRRPLMTFERN